VILRTSVIICQPDRAEHSINPDSSQLIKNFDFTSVRIAAIRMASNRKVITANARNNPVEGKFFS